MRVAMLGTRGVPARHGGFETAVEEIGARLADRGHEVVVYCRNPGQRLRNFKGMRLVNVPAVRQRHLETLSHTALSMLHAAIVVRPQAALVFNAGNAPLIRIFGMARIPTAVHIDGLEWRRAKWAGNGARYFKWAERHAVAAASEVIADAEAIRAHVRARYGRDAVFIPYGAPVVRADSWRLEAAGIRPGMYHLVVARFEPENHVREIVEAYAGSTCQLPLLVVGASPYSTAYSAEIALVAARNPRVSLLGSVWDQGLLDELYGNCRSYVHGHSVGGTNPSLLRAMGAGAPVVAFDVEFNREVAGASGIYFTTAEELRATLVKHEQDPQGVMRRGETGRLIVAERYRWDDVADQYEELCQRLGRLRPGHRGA